MSDRSIDNAQCCIVLSLLTSVSNNMQSDVGQDFVECVLNDERQVVPTNLLHVTWNSYYARYRFPGSIFSIVTIKSQNKGITNLIDKLSFYHFLFHANLSSASYSITFTSIVSFRD